MRWRPPAASIARSCWSCLRLARPAASELPDGLEQPAGARELRVVGERACTAESIVDLGRMFEVRGRGVRLGRERPRDDEVREQEIALSFYIGGVRRGPRLAHGERLLEPRPRLVELARCDRHLAELVAPRREIELPLGVGRIGGGPRLA